jgi:hypothetical protein
VSVSQLGNKALAGCGTRGGRQRVIHTQRYLPLQLGIESPVTSASESENEKEMLTPGGAGVWGCYFT